MTGVLPLRPGLYGPVPVRILAVHADGTLIAWTDCLAVPYGQPGEYRFQLPEDWETDHGAVELQAGDELHVFNLVAQDGGVRLVLHE